MKCFFLSMVCYNRAIIGKEKTVTEVTTKVHFRLRSFFALLRRNASTFWDFLPCFWINHVKYENFSPLLIKSDNDN